MRKWWVRLIMNLSIGIVFAMLGAGPATAQEPTSAAWTGELLTGSLSNPRAEALTGDALARDAEAARWSSPEAIIARERSRTEYRHLPPAVAARLADQKFPAIVDRPANAALQLPPGATLTRYLSEKAADIDLPGGTHAVVESFTPIASPARDHHLAPLNLVLHNTGSFYSPLAPSVPVRIPRHLSTGISTPADGLALTPVSASGAPLEGTSSANGDSVLYANTQTDTDTLAKPTTTGFEIDEFLRSSASPGRFYYHVSLARGARLAQKSKTVAIVGPNGLLAMIPTPEARDSAGTAVPVAMSVSGSNILLTLPSGGDYQYPVVVDPELEGVDTQLIGYSEPTRWKFGPVGAPHFAPWGFGLDATWLEVESSGEYKASEDGYLVYQTQGDSHIVVATGYLKVQNEGNVEAVFELVHEAEGKEVAEDSLLVAAAKSEVYEKTWYVVCADHSVRPTCALEGNYLEYGAPHNLVKLQESAVATGSGYNHANIYEASVVIAQPKGPENPFVNTAEEKLASDAGRPNVMYGSGGWLSQYSGAYEVKAKDPGIGVSKLEVRVPGDWNKKYEYYHEHLCESFQCRPEVSQDFTYNSELPNGEDKLHMQSQDAVAGFSTEVETTLKVDNSAPYNVKISSGMAETGGEITATRHEITVEATEGTKPTPSSGIRAITATVEGKELAITQAGHCPAGECTAAAKLVIPGEQLGVGLHHMVISAVSNANVEAQQREVTFAVLSGSPVPFGPGRVDPIMGQYGMSATDVALAGVGGVSRSYRSQALTAGAEGPLGPQWKLSVGAGDELEILPSGTAVLSTNSSSTLTSFLLKAGGEYESPKGDSNLKLEYAPKEHVYLVKDATAGTTLKFTQPEGSQTVAPYYAEQFGSLGGEEEQFNAPREVAVDAAGKVYVTDTGNNRVEKFDREGNLEAVYGSAGSGNGQFNEPIGIAISPANGDIYVADRGNGRIEVLNPAGGFVRAFGTTGTGAGQMSGASGIALDASENVWVADSNNNRMDEFSSTGTFIKTFGFGVTNGEAKFQSCTTGCRAGLTGSGSGEFDAPHDIAFSGGKAFITDYYNNRIEVFSEAGAFEKTFGSAGSGNGQFNGPFSITTEPITGDLYVSDLGNNRIQTFNTAGTFQSTFGTKGTGQNEFNEPRGIAITSEGVEYIVDTANNRVVSWTRPTWMGTIAEGPAESTAQTFSYKAVTIAGKAVIEPSEELGAKPAGVSCPAEASKAEKGCRELTFKYAETTTATGESPSQWGEYAGRLAKVSFTAYNPATKAMMVEQPVAQYAFDSQGRLRAEWDPRITAKLLKTTYGYDSEGHVTALSPAGQEPWFLHYGKLASDVSTGRLLSVIRPSAGTALASAEAPKNTAVPTLSSSKPAVGTKISVATNGTWSNTPLTYTYVWETCNSAGKECAPIPGAVNQSYYPQSSDLGHILAAFVTAYNSTGAVGQQTAITEAVLSGTPVNAPPEPPSPGTTSIWTVDYQIPVSGTGAPHEMTAAKVAEWGQKDDPFEATAFFPPDEPMGWPAKDYTRASIQYRDTVGRTVNAAAPTGGISTLEYNSANETTRTLTAANRAAALAEGCKSEKECKSAEVALTLDSKTEYESEDIEIVKTTAPEHTIKLSAGEEVKAREVTHFIYNEGAKEVEEKTHEKYRLVTKTTSGALLSNGEEKEVRTSATSYSGQINLGWKLRAPTSVTTDPGGLNLVHTIEYEPTTGRVLETKSPLGQTHPSTFWRNIGEYGSAEGDLILPWAITRDASGDIWVVDAGSTKAGVDEYSSARGEFVRRFGAEGSGNGQLESPSDIAVSNGSAFVTDSGNNRVEIFTETGTYSGQFGTEGTAGGQFKGPSGIALDSSSNRWVVDEGNNRLQEINSKNEFVQAIGFGVSNGEAKFEKCTSACKAGIAGTGAGQFSKPTMIAVAPDGNIYVSDTGNNRVEVFGSTGSYLSTFGKNGTGAGEFSSPLGISVNGIGYVYVADELNGRVEEFKPNNEYVTSFGAPGKKEGQFEFVSGLAISPEGQAYVSNFGGKIGQVEDWKIEAVTVGAHNTKTIYYSSTANLEFPECGEHPEWMGLTCEVRPVTQPGTTGLPELPVTTTAYNVWDAAEATTEAFGTVTRAKKKTFDGAGREVTSEVTSTNDTATPKTTNEYNETTGALEKQKSTTGETTRTVTRKDNTLGQLVEYTDADGNIAKYKYEEGGDERLLEVSQGKGAEAAASQSLSYSPTSGLISQLTDSAAGTFTASYELEGHLTTIGYPDGLTAKYTRNALGETIGVEYVKGTHCTEKCVWFSDNEVPGIHGETIKEASTLSEEPKETYDAAGRLTEVEEIPVGGKGCVMRIYGYDEDSERTSLRTREPGYEGRCATEDGSGGTYEAHTYDPGDRLDDPGVTYEPFGNTSVLPAADAGGHELKTTYYSDSQVATQAQNGQTLNYFYDPGGRTREVVSEGTVKSTVISHYAEAGSSVSWTSEGPEKWTRDIPGIDGALVAIQKAGETPVLQIEDLQGNIVATAALNETETKLLKSFNSTEFGAPDEGKEPPHYAWLGADGVASELTISGTITNGAGSYVPELARSLQTSQVAPPGSYPNGSGPGAPYTTLVSKEALALGNDLAAGAPAREAERQKALEEEAARRQAEAEAAADPACMLEVATGATKSSTGTEWVYARAYGWCGKELLPKYSILEVCLIISLPAEDFVGPEGSQKVCAQEESGINSVGEAQPDSLELKPHIHVRCEGEELTYQGWGWFWVGGEYGYKNAPANKYGKPWQCGKETNYAIIEFLVLLAEFLPGSPMQRNGDEPAE